MNCFIKNGRTFQTRCLCPVLEATYTPWSIYDEVSDFVISAEKEQLMKEGDFLITDDYMGIVKNVQRGDCVATLKCEHIVKLFARELVYREEEYSTLEGFMRRVIEENYIGLQDVVYRLPFIEVQTLTETASWLRPDVEEGVWNLKAFISKVRRLHNIYTSFAATRDKLTVTIGRRIETVKNLDMSSPAVRPIEETYSNNALGRITSLDKDSGEAREWYLLQDGTITNEYRTEQRVDGQWIVLPYELMDDEGPQDVADKVRNEFAKNSYAHKVLFDTPAAAARYDFYDKLMIAKNNRLYHSYIAAIRKTLNSGRVEYLCGELRTTLTDKTLEVL